MTLRNFLPFVDQTSFQTDRRIQIKELHRVLTAFSQCARRALTDPTEYDAATTTSALCKRQAAALSLFMFKIIAAA